MEKHRKRTKAASKQMSEQGSEQRKMAWEGYGTTRVKEETSAVAAPAASGTTPVLFEQGLGAG